jgi:hypothetical protein
MEFQQQPKRSPVRPGRCLRVTIGRHGRTELQQSLPTLQWHHPKPRASSLVAIAQEELGSGTLSHAPNGKRRARAIRQPSHLSIRGRCTGKDGQDQPLDPEHPRGIKREYESC